VAVNIILFSSEPRENFGLYCYNHMGAPNVTTAWFIMFVFMLIHIGLHCVLLQSRVVTVEVIIPFKLLCRGKLLWPKKRIVVKW
jgi:hypothetical protein